jgi:hypothetical protein
MSMKALTPTNLLAGAAGALLGALIGGGIPLGWAALLRRRERAGEIQAMQVEMYDAKRSMAALRKENISAPLYRLPLTMFERGLPKLVGEGLLTLNEIAGLIEYVMRSEELNRGLDRAGETRFHCRSNAERPCLSPPAQPGSV